MNSLYSCFYQITKREIFAQGAGQKLPVGQIGRRLLLVSAGLKRRCLGSGTLPVVGRRQAGVRPTRNTAEPRLAACASSAAGIIA
jgi:hypothetical protein